MLKFLKILGALLLLIVLAVMAAAWWLLDSDDMEPPPLAGVIERGSLVHDGRTRTWQAYIPSSLSGPVPVVLVMHGSMGDGQQMLEASRYGFSLLGEQHGFIPVYPDGFERHWNDCRAGADYSANHLDIDDVGFLKAVVRTLDSGYEVDWSRIYATGLSNGGQMAYRLGLEAPDWIAGVAAMAASLPAEENFDCTRSGQPVAALVINGSEDPVNPHEGGVIDILGNDSRGLVLSSAQTARYWAGLAGYSGDGEHRRWPERAPGDGTHVESTTWSGEGRPPVALVAVIGGGHTIPHPELRLPRILGPTSHEFDAAQLIWDFFSGKGLSGLELAEQVAPAGRGN